MLSDLTPVAGLLLVAVAVAVASLVRTIGGLG